MFFHVWCLDDFELFCIGIIRMQLCLADAFNCQVSIICSFRIWIYFVASYPIMHKAEGGWNEGPKMFSQNFWQSSYFPIISLLSCFNLTALRVLTSDLFVQYVLIYMSTGGQWHVQNLGAKWNRRSKLKKKVSLTFHLME